MLQSNYKPIINLKNIEKEKQNIKNEIDNLQGDERNKVLKQFKNISDEWYKLHIIAKRIPSYINRLIKKNICTKYIRSKVEWNIILPYCKAKKWSKNTKMPIIGYHATSYEKFKNILKEGFFNHSFFTHSNILQSLQVGETINSSYVILLCLFNISGKIIDNNESSIIRNEYKNWKKYTEKLDNLKIEANYQVNAYESHISKKENITIFGYIEVDVIKNLYKIYFY